MSAADRAPPPGSGGTAGVSAEQVTAALRSVVDPELGLSVLELGLVYGIDIERDVVRIRMTLTAPGCPVHEVMSTWVREAVGQIPGVERVEVQLTFDPPWTPERIGAPPGA